MPFPISTTTRPDRRRRHASTPTRLLLSLSLLTATTATRSHQPDLNYRTHCTPQMPQGLLPPHLFTCPLPMTTAPSNPLALSPWTHPPLCVSAAPGKQLKDPHLKTGWVDTRSNKTDQYCVYTNARHGLGGLSIITTPEAAAQITAVVNEMPLDPLAWEPSVAESFNLTDSTRGKRERQPFKIGPIEGKGLGVVATRFIPRMTPIATDYASLVLDLRFPEVVPRKAGYGVLHAAADRLIEPHKKVYGLGRGGNKFAEDVVEDVVRTNAFHAELMGGMYGALFPMISRFNHACRPNAFPRFQPQSLVVSVASARDIQPGEEITISYLTFGQTTPERKAGLQKWGFSCTCDLCKSDRATLRESDSRRKLIEKKRNLAVEAFQRGDAAPAISLTHEILALMRAEDLFPLYPEQYENLARIYRAVGDIKAARDWARRGLDILQEQGYIERVTDEQVEMLMREFEGPPLD